jgi:hypothetical protein
MALSAIGISFGGRMELCSFLVIASIPSRELKESQRSSDDYGSVDGLRHHRERGCFGCSRDGSLNFWVPARVFQANPAILVISASLITR